MLTTKLRTLFAYVHSPPLLPVCSHLLVLSNSPFFSLLIHIPPFFLTFASTFYVASFLAPSSPYFYAFVYTILPPFSPPSPTFDTPYIPLTPSLFANFSLLPCLPLSPVLTLSSLAHPVPHLLLFPYLHTFTLPLSCSLLPFSSLVHSSRLPSPFVPSNIFKEDMNHRLSKNAIVSV